MIASCKKFCVISDEQSLNWTIFQKRFQQLTVIPVCHKGRPYSEVCTQIVEDNSHEQCFIIFEDDVCPVVENYLDYFSELDKQLEEISNWDLLYFGPHLLNTTCELVTKNILKNVNPYCTHAVLYNNSSFETLKTVKCQLPNIHPHCWDDMIYKTNLIKLAAIPLLVTQLKSDMSLTENISIHRIIENSYNLIYRKLKYEK